MLFEGVLSCDCEQLRNECDLALNDWFLVMDVAGLVVLKVSTPLKVAWLIVMSGCFAGDEGTA